MIRKILCLCLWVGGAAAAELPNTVPEAKRVESQTALPAPGLYEAARPLSGTHPGDLLAKEPFAGYDLPPGARATRIVYHSADASGHGVLATAVVVEPGPAAPNGGWPLVAWAHGTSGVARQCAPSLMKDLYYGPLGLFEIVKAGYAIVATDYHGLGSAGDHQYLSKLAQAHDVIYSVPAARKAVSSLGPRWVADGHSQGGMTTWSVAEIESQLHDPNYLGAVSVSGAGNLRELPSHLGNTPGVGFYLSFIPFGIHARYPSFDVHDMLTPAALQRYSSATGDGCWYNGYALFSDLPSNAILKEGWSQDVWAQKFFAENALGRVAVTTPLLVIAGEADVSVPLESVQQTVKAACKAGSSHLSFRTYPGLGHTPSMTQTVTDQLAWIGDRFKGVPAPEGCALH